MAAVAFNFFGTKKGHSEGLSSIPRSSARSRKEYFVNNLTTRHGSAFVALAALGFLTTAAFSADDGWVDLFNGKDLTGWVQRGGKAKYRAEDGQIVGSTVPNTANSFLCTQRNYA